MSSQLPARMYAASARLMSARLVAGGVALDAPCTADVADDVLMSPTVGGLLDVASRLRATPIGAPSTAVPPVSVKHRLTASSLRLMRVNVQPRRPAQLSTSSIPVQTQT